MVSANTDAIMYTIEEEYKEQAHEILHNWEKLTGLELEEDKIIKIIMRDVNNYCEIVQTGDNNYDVHYKGGELTRGEHKFKWNKEKKIFEYSYSPSLKNNSMSIVSEAILKFLLFNTPIEDTINNCNDIFRFQMISHLGSTYEKCVQESENGDIELQRNNRIYAGNVQHGTIMKVKPDGCRDSLANQPPNPIVDNANKLTINNINKEWYIEFAQERANDFLGIPRLESLKKEELLEKAKEFNLEIDKKTKKEELIKILKNKLTNKIYYDTIIKKGDNEMATKQELEEQVKELTERVVKTTEQNEKLVEKIKEGDGKVSIKVDNLENEKVCRVNLNHKINELRKYIRTKEFILDKELPSNLGGGEYHSIGQYYSAIQEGCLQVGLDFSFETVALMNFEKELVKPSGKLPIHVVTIRTLATLTDIDTNVSKTYTTIAQGSDTIDKAVSGAETMAFRQWFTKNFSPRGADEEITPTTEEPKSEPPKTPVYIPETKKEEIKKEVVQQVQQEETDDEDLKEICENIMTIRKITNDEKYGEQAMALIMKGNLDDATVEQMRQKINNKLEEVIPVA